MSSRLVTTLTGRALQAVGSRHFKGKGRLAHHWLEHRDRSFVGFRKLPGGGRMICSFDVPYEAMVWARQEEETELRALQTLLLPPPWHSGRVVLVGDAAHATSPQLAFGIGLAIEDAVVLTELLGSELALGDALETFTERRFPRCRLVVENSRQLGEWEQHPDAPDADPITLIRESMSTLAQPI